MALLVHPGAVRHVDLDPVRAVIELLARRLAGFHGAVDDLNTLGHGEFGSIAFQVVAGGGGNAAGCAEDARAGGGALFNCLLDADVAITGTFSLDVAKGWEAL